MGNARLGELGDGEISLAAQTTTACSFVLLFFGNPSKHQSAAQNAKRVSEGFERDDGAERCLVGGLPGLFGVKTVVPGPYAFGLRDANAGDKATTHPYTPPNIRRSVPPLGISGILGTSK